VPSTLRNVAQKKSVSWPIIRRGAVVFWGDEEGGAISGVMGLQDVGHVTLVRHAYGRADVPPEGGSVGKVGGRRS